MIYHLSFILGFKVEGEEIQPDTIPGLVQTFGRCFFESNEPIVNKEQIYFIEQELKKIHKSETVLVLAWIHLSDEKYLEEFNHVEINSENTKEDTSE